MATPLHKYLVFLDSCSVFSRYLYHNIHLSTFVNLNKQLSFFITSQRKKKKKIRRVEQRKSKREMVSRSRDAEVELNLPPGFRFHPTDEELVLHYLCRKATHQFLPVPIIAEVDLYKYDPWQLPEMALFGRREWYFFSPRDRKYPNGSRPNRAAGNGYWKATGADKPVKPEGSNKPLGIKKALVFYAGKAPRGAKTNWIMHEYRLADTNSTAATNKKGSLRLDGWVLCRLYNKKNDWEKEKRYQQYQQQQMSEDSFEDAGDSMEVRSDIDNDEIIGGQFNSSDATEVGSNPTVVQGSEIVKEDNGWLMDLNLADLHTSSFGDFSGGMSACFQQEFSFSGFLSPLPKTPSQLNLLNF